MALNITPATFQSYGSIPKLWQGIVSKPIAMHMEFLVSPKSREASSHSKHLAVQTLSVCILAEGATALPVTLSGGALFAS
jgi:hypothetical protein